MGTLSKFQPSGLGVDAQLVIENDALSAAGGGALLKAEIQYTAGGSNLTTIVDVSYNGDTRIMTIEDPLGDGSSQTLYLTMLSDPVLTGVFSFSVQNKTLINLGNPPTTLTLGVLNDFTYQGVTYAKDDPLASLSPPYAFEIPPQLTLNVTIPNSQSVHEVMGHFTAEDARRNGFKTSPMENGIFTSTPILN